MKDIVIKIRNEEFFSLNEFAMNMYRFYDEAFVLINTKKFLKLLKENYPTYYEKINELRKSETDNDVFVFKIQYIFNPLMELKFRNYHFSSLKSLGNMILNGNPKIDVYISDLIKNRLLSYYLQIQGYDTLKTKLYKKVLKIEDDFTKNPARAYFKTGFLLAETKKMVYRRRWYDNVSSFFQEVLKPDKINDFADSFEKSQYVFAWLELLGYKNVVEKYESIIAVTQEWEE